MTATFTEVLYLYLLGHNAKYTTRRWEGGTVLMKSSTACVNIDYDGAMGKLTVSTPVDSKIELWIPTTVSVEVNPA